MKWVLLMIGLLGTLLLIYLYWKKQADGSKLAMYFFPALIFKVLAGITAGLIYSFYYEGAGDTFVFYKASWRLIKNLFEDPFAFFNMVYSGQIVNNLLLSFNGRTSFLVLLLSIPSLFSGGIYWVCSFYVSIISFIASWYLVKAITSKYQNSEFVIASVAAFLFFPSVVFWTSGIFKESLSTSAIFILTGSFLKLKNDFKLRIKVILPLILSAVVLIGIKYYLAALILPLVFTGIFYVMLAKKVNLASGQRLILGISFLTLLTLLTVTSHPNLNISHFPKVIAREYHWKIKRGDTESYAVYKDMDKGWIGLASNMPKALFVGLFMPLNFTIKKPLQLASSFENLILILATLLGILGLFRNKVITLPSEILLLIIFIFLSSTLLALTSPNLGTLSRYRVAYSPFYLFLILIPAIRTITNK